jgi:hypothetical protein
MSTIRGWVRRLTGLFSKARQDRELARELDSHLQLHIEDNLRQGMTAEAARCDALIRLGGFEQAKESYRDQRGIPGLETIAQDLRYAARTLRDPSTIVAVSSILLILGLLAGLHPAWRATRVDPSLALRSQ